MLIRLLDQLRKGDVLVVWRLDRLSRSLRDVLMIMERIQEAKAGFRSLIEAIDTTTAPERLKGRNCLGYMDQASLAQFSQANPEGVAVVG